MIKLQIRNAIDAIDALNMLMTQNFKGSLAFKISRLIRELNKELDIFNEARRNLIEKYALRDEENNVVYTEEGNIRLNPDTINDCNKDFEDLLNTEIEINVGKFTMKDIDEFNISPEKIESLSFFIEE